MSFFGKVPTFEEVKEGLYDYNLSITIFCKDENNKIDIGIPIRHLFYEHRGKYVAKEKIHNIEAITNSLRFEDSSEYISDYDLLEINNYMGDQCGGEIGCTLAISIKNNNLKIVSNIDVLYGLQATTTIKIPIYKIRTELYEFMNQLNELNKGIGLVLDT